MTNLAINKWKFKEWLSNIISDYAKITDNVKSSIIDAFTTEKNSAIDYIQDRVDDLETNHPAPPRDPNDLSNPINIQIKNLSTIIENMKTPGKISPTTTGKTHIEQTPEWKIFFEKIAKNIIDVAKPVSSWWANTRKITAETITQLSDEDIKKLIEKITDEPNSWLIALEKMNTSFPNIHTQQRIDNLKNIILELSVWRTGTTSWPAPTLSDTREISASFSDIKHINEQQAQFEAEKELSKKYNKLRWRSLEKIRIFFMRGKIIDQEKKKILASKTMTDKESSTIAERHHQEFENNLALFEQNTFSDPAVEKLCNDFIREEWIFKQTTNTEAEFIKQIWIIAQDPTSELYKNLPADFQKTYGSNLLETMKCEKAHFKLVEKISWIIKTFHTLGTANWNQTLINNYKQEIKTAIKDFSSTYKKLPNFLSQLRLDSSDEKLFENLIAHKTALETIQAQNIAVKLRTLWGWKGALENNNTEKEKIFSSQKLYNFMKKIDSLPRYSQLGIYAAMGWAATATAAVSGSAGAGLGVWSIIIGIRNAFKKQLHYTKEHNFSEQELLRDFSKQKAKMEALAEKVEKYKFLEKYTSRKKRRETREVSAYKETLALSDYEQIETLNKDLEAKLATIDPTDKANLQSNLASLLPLAIKWLVRIDFKKDKNQSLLASNFPQETEKNFTTLLQNIKAVCELSWQSFDDLRNESDYLDNKWKLEANYSKALANFKKEKTEKWRKYWIGSTALYGATGYMSKYVIDSLSNGLHSFQQRRSTDSQPHELVKPLITQPLPTVSEASQIAWENVIHVDIDPALKENLKKTLWDQYEKFAHSIMKSDWSTTLWSTLVKDIFENQQIGNEAKNEIMAYILSATENGKSELISIALDHGMPLDETSAKFQATMKYLESRNVVSASESHGLLGKITNGVKMILWQSTITADDSHSIAQALKELKDSTDIEQTLSSMDPDLKRKVSEFAFCSVGRNGNHGNNFFELFMDEVQKSGKIIPDKDSIPTVKIPNIPTPWKVYKPSDTSLLIGLDATPNTFKKR